MSDPTTLATAPDSGMGTFSEDGAYQPRQVVENDLPDDSLEAAYADSMVLVEDGQIVEGTVVKVDKDEVLVNRDGRAILWSRARSIDLGSLYGEPTAGVDLNNAGHVTGMSGTTPFLWTPQRGMRAIRGKGAPENARAMNGLDQVVGLRDVNGSTRLVVWSPDGSVRDAGLAEPPECPPLVNRPSGTCVLVVVGLDNHGGVGGQVVWHEMGEPATAGFVLSRRGVLEAFQGLGINNTPSGYTDSGFMPMCSWSSTVASVRLPDGRVVPLFDELGGQSYAIAASWDGHILGYGTISASEFRFSILSPRYGSAH